MTALAPIGRPVECLTPADLQAVHRGYRTAYARAPGARPMGAGVRLVALRKDGTTFPADGTRKVNYP